jgi:hypothetical protein
MSAQLSWESVMWIADADRGERIKNPAASASTPGVFSRGRGIAVVAMLVLAVALIAGSSEAATLDVGPNKLYRTPSEAAARARDGDHIEIAPGRYVDCAVWSASNLFVEGVGPGVVIADKSCLDKGIFVIVGNNVTVRNLTLTGARVPGMNGAGIRQEGRNLTVDRVKFIDNQNGILGKDSPQSTVTISNSVFERNGFCGAYCAHGIYFNTLALLRVKNSRFFETRQGHHIKSRAVRTEIVECDISDGPNGTSSYLIDVPNGGSVVVRGNKLEKGPKSENERTAIAIGEEGVKHPTGRIVIENNTFKNDGERPTALVWNVTGMPALLKNNTVSGPATTLEDTTEKEKQKE